MKQAQVFVLARPGGRKGKITIRRQTEPAIPAEPAPPTRPRAGADRQFSPAALQILETPRSPLPRVALGAVCALLITAFLWSYFGRLAVYAEAPGRIQETGRSKVIEPRETGQVSAIRVRDGQHVEKGEVLVELDPTDALATRATIVQKLADGRGDIARWQAEIAAAQLGAKSAGARSASVTSGAPIATAPAIAWSADIPQTVRQREERVLRADLSRLAATLADLNAQRAEKESAKDKFAANVAAQNKLIAVLSETVAMHTQLAKEGWNSQADLLTVLATLKEAQTDLAKLEGQLANAKAAIPVIDSEIAKTRESFIAAGTQSLADAAHQVDDLKQQLAKADQALADTNLRAPVAGTVEASAVTTIGQVVKPGQQLLQIVPQGLPLEIQAYLPNTDVGFVRKGTPVEIKVDAFPYGTYGTIPGRVIAVAGSALPTTKKPALQTASLDGT
ncbi:MAG: HlyD family type I secretion periplasmic adaptor subunit, partial [Stellaceae bacterium]